MTDTKIYNALVLAGERQSGNEWVRRVSGCDCKALIPVGGKSMLLRVIDSLRESVHVNSIWVCGPEEETRENSSELQSLLKNKQIHWIPPDVSPSLSVSNASQFLRDDLPILITTGDHALLTREIIDYFCQAAAARDSVLNIGLARYDLVKEAYPEIRRTFLKFKEGRFCSCNLFIVQKSMLQTVASFWSGVEGKRKKPWQMAKYLSLSTMVKYLLGELALSEALAIASNTIRCNVEVIELPFPESAVDVDNELDLKMVRSYVHK